MRQISISTRIENGEFKKNRKLIKQAIYLNEGKEVELIFKRRYNKRSLPQNAFYWGVIVPLFQNLILEHWGEVWGAEEIHDMLKSVCNYKEIINENTGEIIKAPRSTTELTTAGWLEYEQKIRQFALDFFGATIPEPNEQTRIEFKE